MKEKVQCPCMSVKTTKLFFPQEDDDLSLEDDELVGVLTLNLLENLVRSRWQCLLRGLVPKSTSWSLVST